MGDASKLGRGTVTAMRTDAAPAKERRAELNRRLRLAFVAGADEQSRRAIGRGLTDAELRRVLRRYPGDVTET